MCVYSTAWGQGQMTGLWLLQLHIMLSQRGRGRKRGRGGGGLLQSAATAAYKSYAPVRPRVRPTAIRSLVRTVSRFAAKRQPSFFSSFLVLSVVCRFLRWRKRRRINCAPCSCFGTHPSGDLSHRAEEGPKTAMYAPQWKMGKWGQERERRRPTRQMGSGFKK